VVWDSSPSLCARTRPRHAKTSREREQVKALCGSTKSGSLCGRIMEQERVAESDMKHRRGREEGKEMLLELGR